MSEDLYKNIFSKNLKFYMAQQNKTQMDIIKDLNINKSAISSWVNGTRLPRMDKVDLLAKYFGIKRSDLIEKKITKNDTKERFYTALSKSKKNTNDICTEFKTDISGIIEILNIDNNNPVYPERFHKLALCLNVNDSWLMGYDVPMERSEDDINNDKMAKLIVKLQADPKLRDQVIEFASISPEHRDLVLQLSHLNPDKINAIKLLLD